MPIVIVPVVAILIFAVIAFAVYKTCYIVVPPNKLLVLSGRKHTGPDGKAVGCRLVRSGAVFKIPMIEMAEWMDLNELPVEVVVRSAYTKGGIPANLEGKALVRVAGSSPDAMNAVERFLGRDRSEIATVARETLEGLIRGAMANLSVDELESDPVGVSEAVVRDSEQDFRKLGLELDMFKIRDVAAYGTDSFHANSRKRETGEQDLEDKPAPAARPDFDGSD